MITFVTYISSKIHFNAKWQCFPKPNQTSSERDTPAVDALQGSCCFWESLPIKSRHVSFISQICYHFASEGFTVCTVYYILWSFQRKKRVGKKKTLSHPMMDWYTDYNDKISDANRLCKVNVKNMASGGRVSRPRRCQVVPEPHHCLSTMVTEDVCNCTHKWCWFYQFQ